MDGYPFYRPEALLPLSLPPRKAIPMELSPIPEWIATAICVIALTGCIITLIVCTILGRWGDRD